MRSHLVEQDLVEAVIGLGPNLFYNSPMEACVVVCRAKKQTERRGKILFIDAVHDVARERGQSFLRDEHIKKIVTAYRKFHDVPAFARVVSSADVTAQQANLSIPLFVKQRAVEKEHTGRNGKSLSEAWGAWAESSRTFWQQMDAMLEMLDGIEGAENIRE